MTLATAAIVVLAARAAHNSHRTTIEVLHLMGSTDVQIARLFQRRIALDALFGGMLGTPGSVLVLILLGILIRNIGSDVLDRKSTRLNSSHYCATRMLSFA